MSAPVLRLGDVIPGAELKRWITGGEWRELDAGDHSAAALVVWRMEDDARSPQCEAFAALLASASDLLAAIEDEYAWLANIHHEWPGRNTLAGQQRLCRLRDLICKTTGRDAQDVQDDIGNRGLQP